MPAVLYTWTLFSVIQDWDKGAKESGPAPDGNRAPHRSGGAGPAVEVYKEVTSNQYRHAIKSKET